MKYFYLAMIFLGMAWLAGCATAPPSNAATIEGTWKGQEVRNGQGSASWLTIAGGELEFRGAEPQDWYRATYIIKNDTNPPQLIAVITLSPQTGDVGKTVNEIYEVKPGRDGQATLILSANEPGDAQFPTGFGDRRARQIVFTRD